MARAVWPSWRDGLRRRLSALWKRTAGLSGRPPRRLRLCESLPLGERRFVAVVEFEDARFLVGGTATSLVLLSRLECAVDRPEKNALDDEWAASIESRAIAKC